MAEARASMSEDCLSINVIAPGKPVEKAPVMVFIHGGAYTTGSSREIPRLGEALVDQGGVIFVNFNYRLGALGYLDFTRYSRPETRFESNLGLRDQLAALEWVQQNIESFGGDPDNVTVFGESAGGNAITTMLAVPAANGLFARAIVESACPVAVYTEELTREWAADFVAILREVTHDPESPESDLLLGASAQALVRASSIMRQRTPDAAPGTIAFCPVVDGEILPELPVDAAMAGRTHPVPLIIGTNAREGTLFRGQLDLLATTKPRIRAVFAKTEREARARLFAEYRALPRRRSAAQFGGDFAFWYPSIRYAEGHSQHAPVRFYRFDISTRALKYAGLEATHGLELFALFDLADTPLARAAGVLGGRAAFKRAGDRMRARWLGFARNGDAGEDWADYSVDRRATLIIAEHDRMELDPHRTRRIAWQAFVPHV
jgi:para-nitrobenzyl esterase